MRRLARSIVGALVAVSILAGLLAYAAVPKPDEANTPLTAVSKRDSYVYASLRTGLFRASLAAKRWEKLKTPPEMPLNGTFADQPGRSPLIIYVALRSNWDKQPRGGLRYGLYLSRDDGATWELASERDDFGATLLLPDGSLFAVTGDDGVNRGSHLLRSPDLGKTWRDITGKASGHFMSLEPDPDHPGLVRIQAWALRSYTIVAEDESYEWKYPQGEVRSPGKRPSAEFFSRDSFSSNRFHSYHATLSNYFGYDFGDQIQVQALEIVPSKTRYEFAKGARVVVPVRVVFHHDPDIVWPDRGQAPAGAPAVPKPTEPAEKFADQPDGIDFWGLCVESATDQVVKSPPGRRYVTMTTTKDKDGNEVPTRYQPPAVKYRVFDLSPSKPHDREIDLGRLADFSQPGEYRVQVFYDSGGHTDAENDVWDGSFTSPVFTVVIRE